MSCGILPVWTVTHKSIKLVRNPIKSGLRAKCGFVTHRGPAAVTTTRIQKVSTVNELFVFSEAEETRTRVQLMIHLIFIIRRGRFNPLELKDIRQQSEKIAKGRKRNKIFKL